MSLQNSIYNFVITTPDAVAFVKILYGIRDLRDEIRFFIDNTGIKFGETLNRNNLMVCGSLPATNFESFYCPEPCAIFVSTDVFYEMLSKTEQRDLLTLRKPKKKEVLQIIFKRDGEDHIQREFEIPLMKLDDDNKEQWEQSINEVSYIIGFDTNEFVKIINSLSSLDSEFHNRSLLQITCTEDYFELFMKGNWMISSARVKFFSNKIPQQIKDENVNQGVEIKFNEPDKKTIKKRAIDEKTVPLPTCELIPKIQRPKAVGYYRLRHLAQVTKCMAINKGFIRFYMKEELPLIVEVDCGTLGIMKMTLMYCGDDEDDEFIDEEVVRVHCEDVSDNQNNESKKKQKLHYETEADGSEEENEMAI